MYRLVVIDLDGTLLGHGHRLSSRTRAALDAVTARGAQIVLATGRPFAVAHLFCPDLSLSAPQITYNGAVIYDPIADRALHCSLVPQDRVGPVIDFLVGSDISVVLCGPGGVYLDARITNLDDWAPSPLPAPVRLTDMRQASHVAAIKVVGQADPDTITEIWPRALEMFGDSLYVTPTSHRLIEFLNPAASKGAAVRRIAEKLGVAREEIVTFGDHHNDLTMFAEAGLAVAMGNAPDEVKGAADIIAARNVDDGVAAVLEELFGVEMTA